MKKNEIVELEIIDIGMNGEGIGKSEGFPIFVKDAMIGDVAEVKITKVQKSYGFGRLMRVIKPSKYRMEPRCPVAKQCGGCQIQEMDYTKQLDFKWKKVYNNLRRIGGVSEDELEQVMKPIIGMEKPWQYRNKAQFPFGTDRDGTIITGFYAGRTHSIISNLDCAIGKEINKSVLELVLEFIREQGISTYDESTGKGLLRHVLIRYGFITGEIMVCFVINGNTLPKSEIIVERLNKLEGMTSITSSVNKKNTNVIMGESYDVISGRAYITDYIGDVKYQISPLSFYQVNPIQTKKLYEKALEYAALTGEEIVWDLYCGIGTISLFLAQKAKKVYGVEIIPQAIEDARNNAQINDISNVEFFVGKAEEVLPREYEENQVSADVIVVDPPRKGCEESLLETMIEMQPKRIVYVSCDSATLARDVKYLREHGYGLEEVTPCDMFPHTVHTESVAKMTLQRKD